MQVILIKDVARLGRKSEIKEVPSGHALNFLIPRKLAVIATPESLKRLSSQISKLDEQKQEENEIFANAIQKLSEANIIYATEANEQGHLFKGISKDDIVAHLEEQGISISKNHLTLDHPIKALGIHEIPLKYNAKEGACRLEVVKK